MTDFPVGQHARGHTYPTSVLFQVLAILWVALIAAGAAHAQPRNLDRFQVLRVMVADERQLSSSTTAINTVTKSGAAQTPQCTEEQKLTAADAAVRDEFGGAVSISGNAAIVGAAWDNGRGAVYLFRFDGTNWVQEQKLTASDGSRYDRFGGSVSVNGNTAIIGASGDDDAGSNSGSAYVFRFDGTNWVQEQKLTATDGAAGDYLGRSVSLSGHTAIVG